MNIYDKTISNLAIRDGEKIVNPDKYKSLVYGRIDKYSSLYNIPSGVIKKIILNESGFWFKTAGSSLKNVPAAIRKKYGLGAQYREYGLMQVYPHYAATDGFNAQKIIAYDVDENIHAGTYHLRHHFNQVVDFLQGKPFAVTDSDGNILRWVKVPYKVNSWFFIFTFGIASYNGGVQGIVKAIESGGYKYSTAFKQLRQGTQDYMVRFHGHDIV